MIAPSVRGQLVESPAQPKPALTHWASLYARAEGALDLVDLAHAVQLVAREVQQYQHVRVEFLGDFGDVQLIDFQHDCVSVAAGKQRADHARVHVVAALVSADGRGCADGAGQHAGGCGLAVCARDQHRWALLAALADAEACQQLWVDCPADQAADHAAGPSPCLS